MSSGFQWSLLLSSFCNPWGWMYTGACFSIQFIVVRDVFCTGWSPLLAGELKVFSLGEVIDWPGCWSAPAEIKYQFGSFSRIIFTWEFLICHYAAAGIKYYVARLETVPICNLEFFICYPAPAQIKCYVEHLDSVPVMA